MSRLSRVSRFVLFFFVGIPYVSKWNTKEKKQ